MVRRSFVIGSWVYWLSTSMSSPILGLFVYVTSGSLIRVAEFYAFNAVALLAVYAVICYVAPSLKLASRVYRAGLALLILFYGMLVWLRSRASGLDIVPLLGTLYGSAQGVYWAGWDFVFYRVPDKLKYFNRIGYLNFITSLTAPAVYGSILAVLGDSGYYLLFVITSVGLALVGLILEDSDTERYRFRPAKALSAIRSDRDFVKIMTSLGLVDGFYYVVGQVNPIIIYYIFKSYVDFAIVNYALSALSTAAVAVRDRGFIKVPRRAALVSSLAVAALSSLSAIWKLASIAYLVANAIGSQFIRVYIDVEGWGTLKEPELISYLVDRQAFLNTPRALLMTVTMYLSWQLQPFQLVGPLSPALVAAALIYYLSS